MPSSSVCENYCEAAWEGVDLSVEPVKKVTGGLTIETLRAQWYGQGNNQETVTDEQLAESYWENFYSDRPKDLFIAQMLDPPKVVRRPIVSVAGHSPSQCLASCMLCGAAICYAKGR